MAILRALVLVMTAVVVLTAQVSVGYTPAEGLIYGTVVDGTSGRPIEGARVRMYRSDPWKERTTQTDRTGTFRFDRLPPGFYYLSTFKDRWHNGWPGIQVPNYRWHARIEIVDGDRVTGPPIRLWRTARISGIVRGQRGERLPATISARAIRRAPGEKLPRDSWLGTSGADYRGRFSLELMPGRYRLVASPDHTVRVDARKGEPTRARLDAFFPGVRDPDQADIFDLAPGDDRRDIDVVIPSAPAFDVSGRVTGDVAQSHAGSVLKTLVEVGGDDVTGACAACSLAAVAAPDGSFTLPAVPAGRYTLTSRRWSGGHLDFGDPEGLRATASIDVGDRPVHDVRLTLAAPSKNVAGRIVRRRDGRKEPPHFDDVAEAIDADGQHWRAQLRQVGDESGTVTWSHLPPGQYVFGAHASGWLTRSVTLGGRDVADRPVDVGTGPMSGLTITLVPASESARLAGTVAGTDGRPVRDAHVVIFPSDESLWTPFATRRIKDILLSMNGVLHPVPLPAGDYFVAAVRPEELEEWPAAAHLRRLSRTAGRVSLVDGHTQTVALTVATRAAQAAVTAAGSIAGTVIEGFSKTAVADALVRLRETGRVTNVREGRSDAQGRFRFEGLAPSFYSIEAEKPGHRGGRYGGDVPVRQSYRDVQVTDGASVSGADVRVWKTARLSGTVRDADGQASIQTHVRAVPVQDDEARRARVPADWAHEHTDTNGRFELEVLPGSYRLVVESYAQWFFPGVRDVAGAAVVVVNAGETRAGVDAVVPRVAVFDVVGHLVGGRGASVLGPVRPAVELTTASLTGDAGRSLGRTFPAPDGTFRFQGVPAGEYALEAYRYGSAADMSWGDDAGLRARAAVRVVDRDVTVPSLTLAAENRVTASVRYVGATPGFFTWEMWPELVDEHGARRRADQDLDGSLGRSGRALWSSVPAGKYVVRASGGNWSLKSATLNGEDVADRRFDVGPGRPIELAIELEPIDRLTRLDLIVRTAGGRLSPNAWVLAFSTDKALWNVVNDYPRRIRSNRQRPAGQAVLGALPPGDYFLVAVDAEDLGDWPAPRALERLSEKATRLTVAPGDRRTITLTVARWR